MAYGASCSNPSNNTLSGILYSNDTTPVCDPTIWAYYDTSGDNANARMRDYLLGAASNWNLPTMVLLGQSIQERGGSESNWMQITDSDVFTDFVSDYVTPNNHTGQSGSSLNYINADSINAALAAWYLGTDCLNNAEENDYAADWMTMSGALNNYNAGSTNAQGNYHYAYGLSVLFKAYGETYQNMSISYKGPYAATSLPGTQCRFNYGATSGTILTPSFTVPSSEQYTPYGTNSSGKQIVILVADVPDYVNGLFINQWLYEQANTRQAYLTKDANVAAYSAHSSDNYCVICMGGAAVTAIRNNSFGYSLNEYTSFSSWYTRADGAGYIDASGATYEDNYNDGLDAVQAAVSSSWY